MADEKQAGPGFGGNSAILFLIAASAVYMGWHKPPLVSTRPAGPDYQTHEIVGVQDVDARLWQDPFDAVMRDVEGGGRKPIASEQHHSTTDLQLLLADHPTLAVGVTLPGTPYPEAVETRRRLRYAVLSALHVADFVPEDEKRIGYWRTRDDPKDGRKPKSMAVSDRSSSQVPQIIPFEQFDSINPPAGPKKRIVVFWLDEDFLTEGRQPIGRFEQLMFMLLSPCPACHRVRMSNLRCSGHRIRRHWRRWQLKSIKKA